MGTLRTWSEWKHSSHKLGALCAAGLLSGAAPRSRGTDAGRMAGAKRSWARVELAGWMVSGPSVAVPQNARTPTYLGHHSAVP